MIILWVGLDMELILMGNMIMEIMIGLLSNEQIIAYKYLENKSYCTPKVIFLEDNENIIEINDKKFKIGFMIKVKHDKIKQSKKNINFWFLNPTSDEIRPYRILIKKI